MLEGTGYGVAPAHMPSPSAVALRLRHVGHAETLYAIAWVAQERFGGEQKNLLYIDKGIKDRRNSIAAFEVDMT